MKWLNTSPNIAVPKKDSANSFRLASSEPSRDGFGPALLVLTRCMGDGFQGGFTGPVDVVDGYH
jgi:hypothetical protein